MKTYRKCTHRFHVVAIHQWVVACAGHRMSTVHNSVWFSARLQAHDTVHTELASSCLYSCVCSPHALLPLTYPCWSCSYPQTTYANEGWTIPGSREGWPRGGCYYCTTSLSQTVMSILFYLFHQRKFTYRTNRASVFFCVWCVVDL